MSPNGRWTKLQVLAVLGALIGSIAVVGFVGSRSPVHRQPNVVMVVVDALRRDHVGTYGHVVPNTPFLDELAQRGVVFEDAWSHAPQTFNATAALLTGQVFPLLRQRASASPQAPGSAILHGLAEENRTLAEALAAGGYDTLGIFTNPHHDAGSGFAQGFRLWRYLLPSRAEQVYARTGDVDRAFHELAAGLDPKRPFFAYVHYMDVHNPYLPPPELAVRFVHTKGADRYRNGRPEGDEVPSDDDLHFMMESYDACIRHVDDSLRALAATIADLGRGRDTILVVTADHGDEFMDHGGLGHGHTMYQELLRVPLLVSGDGIPERVRVRGLVRGIDVSATVAALAQVPAPATFEGRSLLPMIDAATADEAQETASIAPRRGRVRLHADEHAFSFAWNAHLRSLTTDDHHLMADTYFDTWELYDVRNDPRGEQNLFGAGGRASRRLRRKMEEYQRRLDEVERRSAALAHDGLAPAVGEHSEKQLRALGYVE